MASIQSICHQHNYLKYNAKPEYVLCGGATCLTGKNKCANAVVHPTQTQFKTNSVLVCCFINRLCNENNLRTKKQIEKYLKKNGY